METGSAMSEQAMTREILTVAQLNRAVASLFERSVPPVWVSGEISNLTRATSGHYYFSLKDSGAQVRAVMFRGRAQYLDFSPRDGDQVEVRALVTLYEPRGDYQLNVEMMRRAGAGDLYQRFLAVKARLQGEGLFDAERKRPLPARPRIRSPCRADRRAAVRDRAGRVRCTAFGTRRRIYRRFVGFQ
jgi:exodeoxyribonuclease VII large subunit